MLSLANGLRRAVALALLSFVLPLPALAQSVAVDPPLTSPVAPEPELRPGEYRWNEAAAAGDAPVRILVSLPLQRAFVFRGDALVGISTVSTGEPGYDTPTGTFPILQKRRDHRSNLYDDAPMPWMQRLTWDGVALHAGQVVDGPASHGCVRLPAAFARRLFAITALGTTVTIVDEAPAEPHEALALASAP